MYRPITSAQGQPLLPTADMQLFAPKTNIEAAKLIPSQHLLSGGIFDFSGDSNLLRDMGYVKDAVKNAINVLISPLLQKNVNPSGKLCENLYLLKSFKAEALLALLLCRPCSVHYKQRNAGYVPYLKNQSHRLVTSVLFWKEADAKKLALQLEQEITKL